MPQVPPEQQPEGARDYRKSSYSKMNNLRYHSPQNRPKSSKISQKPPTSLICCSHTTGTQNPVGIPTHSQPSKFMNHFESVSRLANPDSNRHFEMGSLVRLRQRGLCPGLQASRFRTPDPPPSSDDSCSEGHLLCVVTANEML